MLNNILLLSIGLPNEGDFPFCQFSEVNTKHKLVSELVEHLPQEDPRLTNRVVPAISILERLNDTIRLSTDQARSQSCNPTEQAVWRKFLGYMALAYFTFASMRNRSKSSLVGNKVPHAAAGTRTRDDATRWPKVVWSRERLQALHRYRIAEVAKFLACSDNPDWSGVVPGKRKIIADTLLGESTAVEPFGVQAQSGLPEAKSRCLPYVAVPWTYSALPPPYSS